MFSILRPGMKMDDVDATIRRYNAERLKDAGVLRSTEEIGTYMWYGGAHHIGYDVHDAIERPEILAPNMVFGVDAVSYTHLPAFSSWTSTGRCSCCASAKP